MQFYGNIAYSIVNLLKNSASFIKIRTDSGDVANLQTHNPP
mgnify:CR=1 FL=1